MAVDGSVGPVGPVQPRRGVGVLLALARHRPRLRGLRVRALAVFHRRWHGVRCTLVLSVDPLGGSVWYLVIAVAMNNGLQLTRPPLRLSARGERGEEELSKVAELEQ